MMLLSFIIQSFFERKASFGSETLLYGKNLAPVLLYLLQREMVQPFHRRDLSSVVPLHQLLQPAAHTSSLSKLTVQEE